MTDHHSLDRAQPATPGTLGGEEAYLHTAFQDAMIGMGLVGLDGRWLRVNRSLCELVGRSEAELLGLTFQDITHPDDLTLDVDHLRRLLAGEIASYSREKRYVHKDGHAVWVLLSTAVARGADGAPLHFITQIQDISERNALLERERRGRHEAELERERLAALFAQAPAFMCTLRGPGHVFECANPAYRGLVGFRDVIGKPVCEAVPELRDQGVIELLDRVLSTGEPFVGHEMRVLLQRAPAAPLEERFVTFVAQSIVARDGSCVGVFIHGMDVTGHVRAAEALREGEERFRQLAEHIEAAFYLVDADRTRVIYASPAYECIWGRPVEELYADSFAWREAVHPGDRARVEAARGRGVGFEPIEYRIVRPDGEVRWIRDRGFPVDDAHGRPYRIAGIADDITEQQRSEAARQASEARFRAAFDQSAAGMLQVAPDGRILQVNQRICDTLGYTIEELQSRTVFEITHPEDRSASVTQISRLLAGEIATFTIEKRYLRKDGGVVWVEVSRSAVRRPDGEVEVLLGVATDITERKRAEAALRASQARYERNAANVPGLVYQLLLRPDGGKEFPFISAGARELFGLEPQAIQENPGLLFDMIHPEDRPGYDAAFTLAATTLAPWRWEGRVMLASGEVKWVQGASRLERQPDGSILGDSLLMDVTERRGLQDQLRQAQKMEAVGRLAGGIAHDFNNLLTAILSNTELVLSELADGPVRRDVEVIRQTAARAAGLTRQLLAFSRKHVIEPQLLDLNAIVRETKQMLRRTLGEAITLESDLTSVGCVLADPGQLGQVFLNLAVNARDAMPEGGTLTLRTRDVLVNETMAGQHKGLQPGVYATVAVSDTGIGMSTATQTRVFEPFFTTKDVGKGTGLGLSTVYGIVKQYGGYTAVQSEPGVGTTFTVYLPRHEGPLQGNEKERAARLPTGTETILVVEDETAVRNSIRRILTRQGYTVLEARHGADALRLLDEATGGIALVVTDLMMPEMGGRELIAELRSRPAPPKVLAMSGYDEQAALRGESLPPDTRFFEKPFTVDGLVRAVREAIDAPPAAGDGTRR